MARAKKLRQKIARWEELIAEHRAKIEEELRRPVPRKGLIEKWEKEIANWERLIGRARRRLPGERRSQGGSHEGEG